MLIGAYLCKRREAAGVSIEDVESIVAAGNGRLSAPLAAIEAGTAAPSGIDIAMLALAGAFEFDDNVALAILDGEPQRVCRVCACSEWDPCMPDSCSWVETDLCSECAITDRRAA